MEPSSSIVITIPFSPVYIPTTNNARPFVVQIDQRFTLFSFAPSGHVPFTRKFPLGLGTNSIQSRFKFSGATTHFIVKRLRTDRRPARKRVGGRRFCS
ncbi:hypothetical protein AG1IA_04023 [Rhizoctonia solani AG-1 IA]|uniref:Uncharacterized protein n=1 Tax=Thanatephorus cucumeris (strain AG1-IA) TaxID=983506 RepID=L8WVB6_THACA|nr:hypothetical protein AG1IA_04023 [Rhizoctonia solani AG-1 IA]